MMSSRFLVRISLKGVLAFLFAGLLLNGGFAHAGALDSLCDDILQGFSRDSDEEALADRLAGAIPESDSRDERRRAYLLAAGFYSSGGQAPEKATALLRGALDTEQFPINEEIEIRRELATSLNSGQMQAEALMEFETVRQLAAKALDPRLYAAGSMPDISSVERMVSALKRASSSEGQMWANSGDLRKCAEVMDGYARLACSLATSWPPEYQRTIVGLASKTWREAALWLRREEGDGRANELAAESLAFLESLPGDPGVLEPVRFQLEVLDAVTGSDSPSKDIDALIDKYSDRSWVGSAFAHVAWYEKPPQRYHHAVKLVGICGDDPRYEDLAELYFTAGHAADMLSLYEEAERIFTEFLRRFPNHHRAGMVEMLHGLVAKKAEKARAMVMDNLNDAIPVADPSGRKGGLRSEGAADSGTAHSMPLDASGGSSVDRDIGSGPDTRPERDGLARWPLIAGVVVASIAVVLAFALLLRRRASRHRGPKG